MKAPLDVRFHNLPASPMIEAAVRDNFRKLEGLAPELVSCRVTIDSPQHHPEQGKLFAVNIGLRFAGGEVVASRRPSGQRAHEDAYVAVRDAFDAARRQLEDRMRPRRPM
jgi:ribosome-associated translation inhibitor RaiA